MSFVKTLVFFYSPECPSFTLPTGLLLATQAVIDYVGGWQKLLDATPLLINSVMQTNGCSLFCPRPLLPFPQGAGSVCCNVACRVFSTLDLETVNQNVLQYRHNMDILMSKARASYNLKSGAERSPCFWWLISVAIALPAWPSAKYTVPMTVLKPFICNIFA